MTENPYFPTVQRRSPEDMTAAVRRAREILELGPYAIAGYLLGQGDERARWRAERVNDLREPPHLRTLLRKIASGDVSLYPEDRPSALLLDYSCVDLSAEEIELWKWAIQ